MRAALAVLAMAFAASAPTLVAQEQAEVQLASETTVEPYTAEELDNLLAPVALYPDPILAQVLVASSYPEQLELAQRHVRLYGNGDVDQQPWHISVRAVARYAPVLNLLADRIDWTTALGQAHATQPGDVMESVQSLRRMAHAQGNLVTTREQEVIVEEKYIYIQPAQPRVVYVPVYDPVVIYHRPVVHAHVYRTGWSFGIAFPIGVWLNYDVDWHQRHVYYHGWDHHRHVHRHHGWHHRSRPFIVVNHIYVNPRHTTIVINHRVVNRRVHYDRLGGYNTVHRRTTWDRRRQHEERRYAGRRDDGPSWDRSRRVAPDRDRDRQGPGRAVPRTVPTTRSDAVRTVARSNPAADRGRRTHPSNVPRTPDRTAQRTDGNRIYPTRTNPTRATPDRATADRASADRATPDRATPQRSTPQRTTPQRTAPQRTEPRAPVTRRDAAGTVARSVPRATPRATPQRSSGGGASPQRSAPRSEPRASSGGSRQASSTPRASSGGRSSGRSSQGEAAPRGKGGRGN
jgi:hypothetical protein